MSWGNKLVRFHSVFFFSVHICFAHVCLHLVSKLEKYPHVSCITCFKGVMNWETKIPLMFWHIRSHFTLKHPVSFRTQNSGCISISSLASELVNHYIVYTNSVTGKYPGSLHIGTVITQLLETWLRTTSTDNIVEHHQLINNRQDLSLFLYNFLFYLNTLFCYMFLQHFSWILIINVN